jgi:hypothetical protein
MERAEHLYGGMREVPCRECAARVLVRKHSARHTNVQWSTAAVAACLEFRGRASAFIPGCRRLGASIDEAVRDGLVEVPDA